MTAARARRRSWAPVLAAVVVVVLLLVAAGGYLINAFAAGGSDINSADKAIEAARVDNNKIYDSLKGPSLPGTLSSAQDVQAARQTVNGYATTFKTSSTILDADLKQLNGVDARLKGDAGSVWLLPMKAQLQERQHRVEYIIDAFKSARSLLAIVQTQIPAVLALLDVLDQFNVVMPLLDKDDWNGALAAYPKLELSMQAFVSASGGANIPPQLGTMAKLLSTMTTDLKALLQALQAGNDSAIIADAHKVTTDADALQAIDSSQFDAYETNLLKPYKDAYDADMTKAGFKLQG